jgi:hypothetical protein
MSRVALNPAAPSPHVELPLKSCEPYVRPALIQRVRSEFEEMPGLNLTLPQAALLFGLTEDACAGVLRMLIQERFLRRTESGRFMLADTSPAP